MTGWNIDVPVTEYYGPSQAAIIANRALAAARPFDTMSSRQTDMFTALMNELRETKHIAIDTETTGLTVWKDRPLYFSIAWGGRRATLHACMLHWFQELLKDPYKYWILCNAKYDAHILANTQKYSPWIDATIRGKLVDTSVMHALLYEERPHGLKYMCQHIGGWTWGDFEDQFGKIGKTQSAEELIQKAEVHDFDRLVEYAGNDAWGTLLVYNQLKYQLENAPTHSLFRNKPPYIETLWDLFSKVEVPYTKCLWKMERYGIRVNRERLELAKPEAENHIAALGGRIAKLRGRPFNVNSTQLLKEWLIDERKLAPTKFTKGGKTGTRTASVDASFLQTYADKGDEACKLILEHREYKKLLGTYINGLHELLDPDDRIHTRFNQDVARTGRLSSAGPNLQNIPRPENDHWALRKAFIPAPGYTLLCFDYSQLEMRLLAAASLEQSMIDMIHSGKDIHMGNAEIVFGLAYDDIVAAKKAKEAGQELTAHQKSCLLARNAAKTIGFGLVYGMGAAKLAGTLGITVEEAEAKIEQFLRVYPAIKRFTEEAVNEARTTGYAFTVLGRRRNIPEILSDRRKERSAGERKAMNTPIQGSAADVVKMAQIMYDQCGFEEHYGCRMLLQVHDELIFECPTEHVDVMLSEIPELMRHPFTEDLAVFLDVDGGPGASWGEAK
jgi:DNA polymerase-1